MNVWSSRTGGALAGAFGQFSASTDEDAHFIVHDVIGSIAHVNGLLKAGLLVDEEADALIAGLQDLLVKHENGSWDLDPALEDVHMNIEATLTEQLGDVGKRLHTGRSRNDQVSTCLHLYAREALAGLAKQALGIATALHDQAAKHVDTAWTATTHGQPAQPATIGFLLAAHAWRFEAAAQKALWAAQQVSMSPLGSGAVAGSTLPLDPAYTASLMGLEAPKNALLATGTRDQVLHVLSATTTLGIATSGLCEDLFQLTSQGIATIASDLTTGSSLMPQKRNPDAIELVRGQARALPGIEHSAQGICTPIGLGYVRDLQLVKPQLVQATDQASQMLDILAQILDGFKATASEPGPGIGATDAAEALVANGIPFRTAYQIVAQAHQEGVDPVQSLQATDLPEAAKQAAIDALSGDVVARATLGGPAPSAVTASLGQLDLAIAADHKVLAAIGAGIDTAHGLLLAKVLA